MTIRFVTAFLKLWQRGEKSKKHARCKEAEADAKLAAIEGVAEGMFTIADDEKPRIVQAPTVPKAKTKPLIERMKAAPQAAITTAKLVAQTIKNAENRAQTLAERKAQADVAATLSTLGENVSKLSQLIKGAATYLPQQSQIDIARSLQKAKAALRKSKEEK